MNDDTIPTPPQGSSILATASSGAGHAPGDVLTQVMRRSIDARPHAPALLTYLREQGVTDAAVLDRFRLGAGTPTLSDGLGEADWAALTDLGLVHRTHRTLALAGPGGLNLPTYDPRYPERVVGIVRLTQGQNLHRFITPSVGVGCAVDIVTAERVVLVAGSPLLGLRLAQHGVRGIAIVDDPAVLAPLVDWLRPRGLVVVGYKASTLAVMMDALAVLGLAAERVQVQALLDHSADAALAALGLDRESLRSHEARPPIELSFIRDLHAHATAALERGDGAKALSDLGITDAGFVAVARLGYLSADYHACLGPRERRAIEGQRIGNSIVAPAHDAHGNVVDLLAVHACARGTVTPSLFDQPRGLVCAAAITAFDAIVVTDSVRRASGLAVTGIRNLVVLRGVHDATANAARIAGAGVRRVELRVRRAHAQGMAAALRGAGIAVTVIGSTDSGDADDLPHSEPVAPVPDVVAPAPAPAPPITEPVAGAQPVAPPIDALVLADHDRDAGLAEFRGGDLAYVVEVPWDAHSQVHVRASRGDAHHPSRIDLASDNQRRRFADAAATRLDVAPARVLAHLDAIRARLPDLVRSATGAPPAPAPHAPSGSVRDEAMAWQRAPDLLDRCIGALGDLGWDGDPEAKRLVWLMALSRKLDHPAWAVLTAEAAAGLPAGLDVIAVATPPEDLIQATCLSDHALLHADALRHRLVVMHDLSRVSATACTSLLVLWARHGLSASQVERDPLHRRVRTRFIEVPGPVALIGAAPAGRVDPRLAACLVDIPANESHEQIASELAAERRRASQGTSSGRAATATAILHAVQRLIDPRPVVIPDSEAMAVHPASPRARRDQRALIAIASASALLHQHQRPLVDGCIIASADDLALARRLSVLWSTPDLAGLSRSASRLLAAMRSTGRGRFTMEDLSALLPLWPRHGFRAALIELERTDYLASPTGGRGRARVYHLLAAASSTYTYGVAAREVGGLAEVGVGTPANSAPTVKVG